MCNPKQAASMEWWAITTDETRKTSGQMPWMRENKAFCAKNQDEMAAPMGRDEHTPVLCPVPWPLLVLLICPFSYLGKSKLAWHQLISTSTPKSEELLCGTFPGLATYPEVSSSLYLAKVFVKVASNPANFQQDDCNTAAVPALHSPAASSCRGGETRAKQWGT